MSDCKLRRTNFKNTPTQIRDRLTSRFFEFPTYSWMLIKSVGHHRCLVDQDNVLSILPCDRSNENFLWMLISSHNKYALFNRASGKAIQFSQTINAPTSAHLDTSDNTQLLNLLSGQGSSQLQIKFSNNKCLSCDSKHQIGFKSCDVVDEELTWTYDEDTNVKNDPNTYDNWGEIKLNGQCLTFTEGEMGFKFLPCTNKGTDQLFLIIKRDEKTFFVYSLKGTGVLKNIGVKNETSQALIIGPMARNDPTEMVLTAHDGGYKVKHQPTNMCVGVVKTHAATVDCKTAPGFKFNKVSEKDAKKRIHSEDTMCNKVTYKNWEKFFSNLKSKATEYLNSAISKFTRKN